MIHFIVPGILAPDLTKRNPVEVLEDARGRRGETGIVHMVMVNDDTEGPTVRHELAQAIIP